MEYFDGDGAVQSKLLGVIHVSHAARADKLVDPVSPVEDLAHHHGSLRPGRGFQAAETPRPHASSACSKRTRQRRLSAMSACASWTSFRKRRWISGSRAPSSSGV